MDSTIKFCRKSGYVNNIFGRRSHFNGINDKNFNVRNVQERAAINAPIQGSASEIMRLAMIRLDKRLLENFYKNLGYFKVQVLDSFAQFNNELGFFELIYNINAGNKFFFNDFDLNYLMIIIKKILKKLLKFLIN